MAQRKRYKGFISDAKDKLKKVPIWAWVLGGAGLLFLTSEATGVTDVIGGTWDWAKNQAFKSLITSSWTDSSGVKYSAVSDDIADAIIQVAQETGVSPALIYAIGNRESGWGKFLDSNMTGDNGHGHGYMQIDDRTWGSWLDSNDWKDPYNNISFAISNVFLPQRDQIANDLGWPDPTTDPPSTQDDLDRAAVVAYNHGVSGLVKNVNNGSDWDTGTTGGNYSSDVLDKRDAVVNALV